MKRVTRGAAGLVLALAVGAGLPSGSASASGAQPAGSETGMVVRAEHAKLGRVYYVSDPQRRDGVSIRGSAMVQDFQATTRDVTAYFAFEHRNAQRGMRGVIRVPTDALRTGNDLTDELLATDLWLDADANPYLEFSVEEATNVSRVSFEPTAQTYTMTLVGPLKLNGVVQRARIPARVTYLRQTQRTQTRAAGNLLMVRLEFDVSLAAHDVTGPPGESALGITMPESVTVRASLLGTDIRPMTGFDEARPAAMDGEGDGAS